MGCLAGVFYPNENYARIRDVVREFSQSPDWKIIAPLSLSVRPENGVTFEPVGGVTVEDYADELEDESARELNVFGLPHDDFRLHFREAFEGYYGGLND